jgi:hypothetical protein
MHTHGSIGASFVFVALDFVEIEILQFAAIQA